MKPRVLMYSLRGLRNEVFRCFDYEFEDVIREVDAVELTGPQHRFAMPLAADLAQYLAYRTFRLPWNPAFRFPPLKGAYDLFFANMTFFADLEVLHRMPDWRNHVGCSVCFIDECFRESLTLFPRYLDVLRRFDLVIVSFSGTREALQAASGVRTLDLSFGVDTCRFFPGIKGPARRIDLFNIGRKDPLQHRQFLRLRDEQGWFYLYDTVMPKAVSDHCAHRDNTADLLARTCFWVVNPAKFNARHETAGQEEIGFRYYEGAAAGAVMVGFIPDNPNFPEYFPWPDAVMELPADPEGIPECLLNLSRQEERLRRIRFRNVLGSLQENDFLYRWEAILAAVGLDPHPAAAQRRSRLETLMEQWTLAHPDLA